MELFFKLASPATLASLMADLQNSREWTDQEDALHNLCAAKLVAIVGQAEAIELLKAAGAVRL